MSTVMNVFQWSPIFETGISRVDHQHKRMVEIINHVGPMLADLELAEQAQRDGLLDELASYAVDHFAEEEDLMMARGLDPDFISAHIREHRHFCDEVAAMRVRADGGKPDSVAILRFLISWLTFHILGIDQSMAEQMRQLGDGHTAAEALVRSRQLDSIASRPLLDAMTSLYQVVSLRNRELREVNSSLEAKVIERTAELTRNEARLRESEAQLRKLSVTDSLTGLANRRRLEEFLQAEFQRAERFGSPVSVIIADLDHFKNVNDNFGHDVGDDVLCAFASLLTKSIREIDLVARLGGEEFVVVMPGGAAVDAAAVAERLRTSTSGISVKAFPGALKASFGVAALQPGDTLHSLLKRADEALYAAKRNGRNRVETFSG